MFGGLRSTVPLAKKALAPQLAVNGPRLRDPLRLKVPSVASASWRSSVAADSSAATTMSDMVPSSQSVASHLQLIGLAARPVQQDQSECSGGEGVEGNVQVLQNSLHQIEQECFD